MKLIMKTLFLFSMFSMFSLSACFDSNDITYGPDFETETKEENEFEYNLNEDGTYTLVACDSQLTDLILPSTHNGLSITKIGKDCFSDCRNLKTIFISENIVEIEEGAFRWLSLLEEINFAENSNLEIIDKYVFSGCTSLEYILFPEKIRKIDEDAFGDSWSYNPIKLLFKNEYSLGLSYYNNTIYTNCDKEHLVIEDGVIYYNEFGKASVIDIPNKSDKKVIIKGFVSFGDQLQKVIKINDNCFTGSQVKQLEIPSSIEEVSEYAFQDVQWDVDVLSNLVYNNGRYVGNPENPHLIFVQQVNSSEKVIFHDNCKFVSNSYSISENSIRLEEGIYYIPSDSNPYFVCYEIETVNLYVESKDVYINDNTRIMLTLTNGYGGFNLHLPSKLETICASTSPTSTGSNMSYFIDSSNENYQTIRGSLYKLSYNTNTLISASKDSVIDGTLYIAEGTNYIANDSISRFQNEILLLPESLVAIGDNALYYNTFKYVNIPENLYYLGNLFSSNADRKKFLSENVLISPKNSFFIKVDNNIVSTDREELYLASCKDELNCIVPEYVKKIKNHALTGRNIFIGNNVESIEKYAISPQTSYGNNRFVFLDCFEEKPGFEYGWNQECAGIYYKNQFVKDDDSGLIYGKRASENGAVVVSYWRTDDIYIQKHININGKTLPITVVGRSCFMGENFQYCNFASSYVVIPDTVHTIESIAFVFFRQKPNQTFYIPNSVKSIPSQAFHCSGIIRCESQSQPDGWVGWQYGCDVFWGCTE